ncbi:MAG: D-alanine--D-alanine ligase [Saprospirales bacterium]|nr:D-alanine--D-alanine ligase [Saprospirales bacterium]
MNVGIFFGGPSREREISFAGGRTVYDNLDKSLFHPVPIFVDSHRQLILLEWPYLYKGTIRDFYPPIDVLPPSPHAFQIYLESLGPLSAEARDALIGKVGRRISLEELPGLIDVAFLALHGEYGEDGQLQGLLESLQIPYTGSGIRACSIGIDKAFQKKVMEAGGFSCPKVVVLSRSEWVLGNSHSLFSALSAQIGFPMVIRPANQGSSIGVSILPESAGHEGFYKAVNRAFFREEIDGAQWTGLSREEKINYLRELTDIRDGLGFPIQIAERVFYHPEALLEWLENHFADAQARPVFLESHLSEQEVILESFIRGKEFSCIVIRTEDGRAVSLPPTEIIKGGALFDYRSKYLPGLSRKQTPILLPDAQIEAIRRECERLFFYLGFQTYARIDGFITADGTIFLNDPNTTSGMLPSSFFFHQAAEIGLSPSQFLTYIIRISIQERIWQAKEHAPFAALLPKLDQAIETLHREARTKKRIAIILGGYSYERHISVESGRNIFEKLSSSEKYEPIPVFLAGKPGNHTLYQIPINLLLKDNADDIRDKIAHFQRHPVVEHIKQACIGLTRKYASATMVFEPQEISYPQLAGLVDGVFIALHGRPGEDGEVQKRLEEVGLPYNGSGPESSNVTINKYETLQLLKQHGFTVTEQLLVDKEAWSKESPALFDKIEKAFTYPLIAKPVDDGCSSAVKVIKSREQLDAYFGLIFRPEGEERPAMRKVLRLDEKEEFPSKEQVLLETLVTGQGATHFLEITGGMLTHYDGARIRYEIFEPSEALASGEVLSLEEKFLAGEGQNITPARFSPDPSKYAYIAAQVKRDLERAARLLNVQGYARIDAFVRIFPDNRVETIIIEVNSLPGMTPATCIYHQAAINGYKPYDFIDKILEFGFHDRKADTMVE